MKTPNQKIKMISKSSCDTEAFAITWINCIFKCFYKNRKHNFKLYIIFYNVTVFLYFDQINADLVIIRDILKNNNNNLTDPKLLKGSVSLSLCLKYSYKILTYHKVFPHIK